MSTRLSKFVLAFVCAEFEGSIERAERHDGRQSEDSSQHDQDDAESSSDDPAEVEVCEQCGNYEADNTIGVGHIAFHWIILLVYYLMPPV